MVGQPAGVVVRGRRGDVGVGPLESMRPRHFEDRLVRHRPREARRLFVTQASHEGSVEQLGVGRGQRVEVAAHDGGTARTPFVDRLQDSLHLFGPVSGVSAVLQVGRCELHRDAAEVDGGEHGDTATHPGLGRIGGEPPGTRSGQPDDDRFAEVSRRHDGVAVETPLVDAAAAARRSASSPRPSSTNSTPNT